MLLIKATDIKKSYGEKEILNFKEFSIYRGDKIGLVGLNGGERIKLAFAKLFVSNANILMVDELKLLRGNLIE